MKAIVAILGMLMLGAMSFYVEWRWKPLDQIAFYTAIRDLLAHRWRFAS